MVLEGAPPFPGQANNSSIFLWAKRDDQSVAKSGCELLDTSAATTSLPQLAFAAAPTAKASCFASSLSVLLFTEKKTGQAINLPRVP